MERIGELVLTVVNGMTLPSTTRNRDTPRTLRFVSTTAHGSVSNRPILQVETMCQFEIVWY